MSTTMSLFDADLHDIPLPGLTPAQASGDVPARAGASGSEPTDVDAAGVPLWARGQGEAPSADPRWNRRA